MPGERAYLAVLRSGALEVVPVSLQEISPAWKEYKPGTPQALTFFSRLALGQIEDGERSDDTDFIFAEMLKLSITALTASLIKSAGPTSFRLLDARYFSASSATAIL